MVVTLVFVGTALDKLTYKLLVSTVSTYLRLVTLFNWIKSQMLPRKSISSWQFRHYLETILLLVRNGIEACTNTIVRIVLVKILECVLSEAQSSFVWMLLF
jgi:hypothetical protein